jgi:hypothetical protein
VPENFDSVLLKVLKRAIQVIDLKSQSRAGRGVLIGLVGINFEN